MLSVLIPTYNYSALSLVTEIHKQCEDSGIEYEINVLDDGSSNQELLKENELIKLLKNCNFEKSNLNQGRTYTRKLLAEKAKYNWLLFIDSDTLPSSTLFIEHYINQINKKYDVIVGGCKYQRLKVANSKLFRYTYGINREEKSAEIRNKKQYSYILSGNLLIKKEVFLATNFNENQNIYGLDIYFTYQLFKLKSKVLHIENPIYHIGIEDNEIFFNKSISSLNSRIQLLKDKPHIEEVDKMIKLYNLCKKYKFDYIINPLFKVTAPFLKKCILSNKPNIVAFDLYRLGYICGIKK